eukprot:5272493-Amphidinium_carterae.1
MPIFHCTSNDLKLSPLTNRKPKQVVASLSTCVIYMFRDNVLVSRDIALIGVKPEQVGWLQQITVRQHRQSVVVVVVVLGPSRPLIRGSHNAHTNLHQTPDMHAKTKKAIQK